MSPRWRHYLRRLRFILTGLVAGAVIVFALLMALGQLVLPLAAHYPERIAAMLGDRLHRPVTFASLEGHWQGSGPLFVLRDLTVAPTEGGSPLHLPQAELKLDFGSLLVPSRHLLNLRARGMKLELVRAADGRWTVTGFGTGNETQPASFGNLSVDLWLSDLRVDITDGHSGQTYQLAADQLRLTKQGRHIRFGGLVRRQDVPGQLHVAGRFTEDGSSGKVYVIGSDIDLASLTAGTDMDGYSLVSGKGEFESWLDWRKGRVVRSVSRIDLDGLAVKGSERTVAVSGLHGLVDFERNGDTVNVHWLGNDGGELALAVQSSGQDSHGALTASRLDIAPLAPWASLAPEVGAATSAWLGGGHPHGTLTDVEARWSDSAGLESARAVFHQLGISAVGTMPGIDRLDGEIRGDGEAISLSLPAQAATLDFAGTFRRPFVLSLLAGDIVAWHDDGAWHIGTDAFDFRGEGFGGQARGEFALPDDHSGPFLELYANLERGTVPAAKLFWPLHSMSEGTMHWLDRGLVSGSLDSGAAVIRGNLRDWPFRNNEGRFEGRGVISDLVLDYGEGWPRAEGVAAVASFVDNGMLVEASAGQTLGTRVEKAVATIPDFHGAVLGLEATGSGTGGSFMDFVKQSPVGRGQKDTLDKLKLGGTGTFGIKLNLPLTDAHDFTLDGQATLKDADLLAEAWNIRLDKLTGPLVFDGKGLKGGPLATIFHGQPATLNLAIAGATGDPKDVFTANLDGRFAFDELLQGHDNLRWIADVANGRGLFSIGLDIAHGDGDALAQNLRITSDLRGIELTLPVPLKKAAEASLPLDVQLGLPLDGSRLDIALGNLMRARLRLAAPDRPLGGVIELGGTMPSDLPAKGLRILGETPKLDVSGWVQYVVGSASTDTGPGLDGIDIRADEAGIFGQHFTGVRLQATPGADQLALHVDSDDIAGELSVPNDDLRRRGITARMARLHWPADDDDATKARAAAAAAPAQTAAATAAASARGDATTLPAGDSGGVAPSSLPPLHLQVTDMRLGKAKLGEARLETWPTAQGMHIDQLRATSKSVQITASGDWNGDAKISKSHLQMDFASEDVGRMLDALGFGGVFGGGSTQARLNATWPGGPSALALANIDGDLRIDINKGRILEVQPGVGRLFGLISVVDLPRRLSLDFGDVLGKGFAFDSITGNFRFAGGNAHTDNLVIRGPAAEITITGRTGLRARDYDQLVLVVPHVGNSLPVVGAIAAGPIGIAAGLAAQGLLGRGLNEAARKRYKVSGSWDKPVFTPLDRNAATGVAQPTGGAP